MKTISPRSQLRIQRRTTDASTLGVCSLVVVVVVVVVVMIVVVVVIVMDAVVDVMMSV